MKIFQLQSMSNVSIRDLRSRILVYLVWPLYSTWAIKNDNPARKKSAQGCEIRLPIHRFWLRRVVVCRATWDRFSQVTETLCTEPVSVVIRALLYWFSLYNFFSWISSVAILRQQHFNSYHEHPTPSVLEHFESGPGPGLGHMCGPGALAWS